MLLTRYRPQVPQGGGWCWYVGFFFFFFFNVETVVGGFMDFLLSNPFLGMSILMDRICLVLGLKPPKEPRPWSTGKPQRDCFWEVSSETVYNGWNAVGGLNCQKQGVSIDNQVGPEKSLHGVAQVLQTWLVFRNEWILHLVDSFEETSYI